MLFKRMTIVTLFVHDSIYKKTVNEVQVVMHQPYLQVE